MSIVAVRVVGGIGVDPTTGAFEVCVFVVEEMAGGVFSADDESVKCIVMTAGPSWSFVRLIVIGIAGLWYFKRGR
jgi:hypothetical protein